MNDRIISLCLLLLGLAYGSSSLHFELPFGYDPLGPRPVPLFLALALIVLSLLLLIRPQRVPLSSAHARIKSLWLFSILIFYQLSWSLLGFLLSTTISLFLASRLFRCSWMQGLMTALILAVSCYGLFNFILAAHLPLGQIFDYRGE